MTAGKQQPNDQKTANAFATSWNNLPAGSVYTHEQFLDWMTPFTEQDIRGKHVLELGCGNASLMVHVASWEPAYLEGVDLGDSVLTAESNLETVPFKNWKITKADMTEFAGNGFDIVYSIGVLHHLKDPKSGFNSVIRNTKPEGKFHCWVYAREGNSVIVYVVDPIRKIASRLPWWITKYFIATPLAIPFFLYAKSLSFLPLWGFLKKMPLYEYCLWIGRREFAFFRHVAFDQLVTPQTTYITHAMIESWLKSFPDVDQESTYIIMRNGNSWKFGGTKRK